MNIKWQPVTIRCYLSLKFSNVLIWLQNLRRHGDIIQRTVGNYYIVHGRVDDTMNLGGIKVTTVPKYSKYCPISEVSIASDMFLNGNYKCL